ncbi:MAG: helicase RepA family protein [Gemmataceae bacterium]|nr:helicase RepA family protein [Gemmataceae bacterium]
MVSAAFDPCPMDRLVPPAAAEPTRWVWDGYLARGNLSLLTSQWKAGKTTLVAGLLRAMAAGTPFLGRRCVAGHAVVVSEESPAHWADRARALPLGPHARLVSRPFPLRPTLDQWYELVGRVGRLRETGPVDLVVVDPLATFLPGRSDSDPAALRDFLDPLRLLAKGGTAVLVLHHPRKARAEEGSSARGSGALLGAVDVVLELHRLGQLPSDANRRRLVGRSRLSGTPPVLAYEWVPGTPEFRVVEDVSGTRFRENWEVVRGLLGGRPGAATHRDLLADWPADRVPPSPALLYDWLGRAVRDGRAVRSGGGTKNAPFRFALASDQPCQGLADPPPLE